MGGCGWLWVKWGGKWELRGGRWQKKKPRLALLQTESHAKAHLKLQTPHNCRPLQQLLHKKPPCYPLLQPFTTAPLSSLLTHTDKRGIANKLVKN